MLFERYIVVAFREFVGSIWTVQISWLNHFKK